MPKLVVLRPIVLERCDRPAVRPSIAEDTTDPELTLVHDVQVAADDPWTDRIALSSGTVLAERTVLRSIYDPDAIIPRTPWRPPSPAERNRLTRGAPLSPPARYVRVVRIPPSILTPFEPLAASAETPSRVQQLVGRYEIQAGLRLAAAFVEQRFGIRPISTAGVLAGGIRANSPGLETVTVNSRTGRLLGLHLDSWSGTTLNTRDRAPLRIAINIGSETRYFLFAADAFNEEEEISNVRHSHPGPSSRSIPLPPRFALYLNGLRTSDIRPRLGRYPGLSRQPWHDPRRFPIVADLERHAAAIADEVRQFNSALFPDEAEDISRTGRWGVLFLLDKGRRYEDNLVRCPTLRRILDESPSVMREAGLVYFSCVYPHSHVAPHRGPTNLRLRCHLGLEVPDRCGIRVGGITKEWHEGRCLVMDDSFVHEVWNESDRARMVLVLDLWHPDLTPDEISLLSGLNRYGVSLGSSTQSRWLRNDEAQRRVLNSHGAICSG